MNARDHALAAAELVDVADEEHEPTTTTERLELAVAHALAAIALAATERP